MPHEVKPSSNMVTAPPHYTHHDIEPLDVIEDWNLPHHLACVLKYIARWEKKGGLQDLQKARYYLDRFIRLHE